MYSAAGVGSNASHLSDSAEGQGETKTMTERKARTPLTELREIVETALIILKKAKNDADGPR